MHKVFKYPLERIDVKTELWLPEFAEVLCVGVQGDDAFIWAKVDTSIDGIELRKFAMYGTGHDMENGIEHKYVGSIFPQSARFVFHIFEVTECTSN